MEYTIKNLFKDEFVNSFFKRNILPKYKSFKDINKISIKPNKDYIFHNYYHVVIEYEVEFINKLNEISIIYIYCTAHSNEPRKYVYDNLIFLWKNNFGHDQFTIPRPLYYSKNFNATFYQGIYGNNLYYYIKENNHEKIENIVKKAAKWFAKLHNIPTDNINQNNYKIESGQIETVIPGMDHILEKLDQKYPKYFEIVKKIFNILKTNEHNFFNRTEKKWVVHGDAHPENVIEMDEDKIALIDFTDLCLSDFARDLGAFTQQLEYMITKKIKNTDYAAKIKQYFLDVYFEGALAEKNNDVNERIKNYYNWTAMRTATFFLMKHDPSSEKAEWLINNVKNNLNL